MSLTDQLLEDAEKVAKHREISLARLATIIVNDGKFFANLRRGKSCTVRTFEAASKKLRDLEPQLFVEVP